MSFVYNDDCLSLFDHAYNQTARNERAVELPVALRFIEAHGIDLELGHVLGHYGITGHRVVDRWEQAPGVDNLDVFDLKHPVCSLVAISTLEHIRWDEGDRDPRGAILALQHLRLLASRMLITVPMGYHPPLDDYLLHGDHGAHASTLIRDGGGWVQTEPRALPYGPWANSVWIGEWT